MSYLRIVFPFQPYNDEKPTRPPRGEYSPTGNPWPNFPGNVQNGVRNPISLFPGPED